tara:strand:- start:1978 stop:2694 length:717 start_codon:yes stop_codon:yes gene_type:complete
MMSLEDRIVRGLSSETKYIVVGHNTAAGTAIEDVTQVGATGTINLPASAVSMEVVSSSADDDSAGTGVRTVQVYGLDSSHAVQSESVTMDGTTPVATANSYLRINAFYALTTGSGLKAAGNIDIRHVDDTPLYARIPTGYNTMTGAQFTVPAGKTAYVNGWWAGGASNPGRVFLMATKDPVSDALITDVFQVIDTIPLHNKTIQKKGLIQFPAQCDIKFAALALANNMATSAGFMIYF